jgi:hypothetical protein
VEQTQKQLVSMDAKLDRIISMLGKEWMSVLILLSRLKNCDMQYILSTLYTPYTTNFTSDFRYYFVVEYCRYNHL